MNITVIISVYKDTQALEFILDSLNNQTYLDFNILISEDCESYEMKKFISNYNSKVLISHISQKDISWRKNKALNNAIRNSTGDYLIFLDGDIIPYSNFIEMHQLLAEKNKYLSGRRVELGPFFSKLIRKKIISYTLIEKYYLLFFIFINIDKARHSEEGILLKPNSYLEKIVNKKKRKNMMLVGCNFSCWKKDLEKINGFDEDYNSPSVGEDVDLSWRFKYFNITTKSVRYIANTFHLYHTRNWNGALERNNKIMKIKMNKKEYICLNGINNIKKNGDNK
jgi:cellulose synthase/poly-beta-1,6-N-acetylglucosamine synthase-like glycosyltransferase